MRQEFIARSEILDSARYSIAAKLLIKCAPGRIRTADHLVRSQVLYPAELRAQAGKFSGNTTRHSGGDRAGIDLVNLRAAHLSRCRRMAITQ